MKVRSQIVNTNELLPAISELIKSLDEHFDDYQNKIESLTEELSENDLIDFENGNLEILTNLFDLVGQYYAMHDQTKAGGADAIAELIEDDLAKFKDFTLILSSPERWQEIQNLLVHYYDKYHNTDLENENYCRRVNTIGLLMALEMNLIYRAEQKPFEQKKEVLRIASETLKGHYLGEIHKGLATAPERIKPSYNREEITALKADHVNNKIMSLTLDKYQAISNICESFEAKDDERQSPKQQVENFQINYQANISTLKKNRDKATETFMKIAASILLCATFFGGFFVKKVWETKGHKYEKQVNAATPRP